MYQQITDTAARYRFDSMPELFDYIETAPRTWPYKESATNRPSQSWDLNLGYDGALRLAREGWIEGAERAQEALRAFTPKSPAPDTKTDFFGHMPHVPRYCAGAPDNMLRHTNPPTVGGGRVITLYVAVNANCMQKAQNMANYGLGIAQYINQLETEGLRVEVHAAVAQNTSSGTIKRVAHTVCVKRADQPLDLAVMAFAIGHPAMFRRLWFALAERCAGKPCMGYYYPERVKPSDIIDFPQHAYVLNGMLNANSQASTPQLALANVEKEINIAVEAATQD